MVTVHFSTLRSNLGEIYAALHAYKANQPLDLYPYSSSKVCFQGTWMGRVVKAWTQFKKWIESFFTINRVEASLDETLASIIHTDFTKAIRQIYQLRQRQLVDQICLLEENRLSPLTQQERDQQLERYQHFLLKEQAPLEEQQKSITLFRTHIQSPLNKSEKGEARCLVLDFHQAAHPFWKILLKNHEGDLRRPLSPLIARDPSFLLANKSIYKALNQENRRVFLERIVGPLPIAALAKMRNPEAFSIGEKKMLRQWIDNLNDHQNEISFKDFIAVLEESVAVIHIQGQLDYSIDHLLIGLNRLGCQLLQREDPTYINWRERLKPGDSIECNGKLFRLGNQLSPDKVIDDECKIFALEGSGNANFVIKFSNNYFKLKLEAANALNEKEQWGVRSVQTIQSIGVDAEGKSISGLDRAGKCVILEKLHTGLGAFCWTSQTTRLKEKEEQIALILANHLYCQCQWKASSQNLSVAHLLFDEQGLLKSTRLLQKGQADYNVWEQFCHQVAKGNTPVLVFLMRVSKLSEHEIAKFYREEVEYTLEIGETRFLSQRQPIGHQEGHYLLHAENLCEQAKKTYLNCLKWARAQRRRRGIYNQTQEEALKREVKDQLLALYRLYPTPGILPDSWEQLVMAHFNSVTSPAIDLTNNASPDENYYQAQFDLMMAKNQAALEEQILRERE